MENLEDASMCHQSNDTGVLVNKSIVKPVCLIVLGMAGSGKTTFVQVKFFILIFFCMISLYLQFTTVTP